MKRTTITALMFVVLSGCDFTPEWNCLTAKDSIELFKTGKVETPAGTFESGKRAEILDRIKGERDITTHFQVRTEDGTEGWFAWTGTGVQGGTRSDCF